MSIFDVVDNFKELEGVESRIVIKSKVKNPVFTIAIPTYKRHDLIRDTVKSALYQKVNFEYEVIVVDNDDSGDSETECFLRSINDYKLAYYKNTPNVGMVGNHNQCFKLSKADYVVILHDDDILLPFALEAYQKVKEKYPQAGMITSNDYDMKDNVMPKWERPLSLHIYKQAFKHNYLYFSIQEPSGTLYNKRKFMEIGGYNPHYYPCFDYAGAMLMLSKSDVYTLKEKLLIYRWEANESLSSKTIIASMEQDIVIRKDIGEILGLSKCVINYVNRMSSGYRYRLISDKEYFFRNYKGPITKFPSLISLVIYTFLCKCYKLIVRPSCKTINFK